MIDAHVHLWQVARGDYGWMTPDMPIHRDYTPQDLRPLLGGAGAILVQAAATDAETAYMLGLARASGGMIRGVVGWTDLDHDAAPGRIDALAREPLLRGLRPMLQDIAETEWVLRPRVLTSLSAMRDAGLRLDALGKIRHLPVLAEVARLVPGLQVVIDHAAKPDIAGGGFDAWAGGISHLAAHTDWCCKLSGLATEAGAAWTAENLRPYIDHLLACFGPDRLLWGSDWPVVTLASSYDRWHATARALTPLGAHAAVFGGTARRFYGV